jgi:multiple sugar transport system substrate-binding protein
MKFIRAEEKMKISIIGPDDPALEVTSATIANHPEWEAELTILPWVEYRAALMASISAKPSNHQAVFVPGHVWIPELVEKGLLSALDPIIGELSPQFWQAYQHEKILEKVDEESRFDDRQYMVPTFTDGHLLFYRSDLVDLSKGDAIPVVSCLSLAEIVSRVHHPPEIYGLALKAHPSEILFDWLPFFYEAGGEIFDSTLQPAFAGRAGITALETYCQLRKYCPPDTHQFGNAEIAAVLKNGKAALVTLWGGQTAPIFFNPQNEFRERYKAAIYSRPCGGTWGVAIPANQPEQVKRQALQVALQINSPLEDMEITYKSGSPIRSTSYTEEAFQKCPWLKAQYEMMSRINWLPKQPETGLILGPLTQAIYKAFTGEGSAKETLASAAQEVGRLLENRK